MTGYADLLPAIKADPEADQPRLEVADWLDDHATQVPCPKCDPPPGVVRLEKARPGFVRPFRLSDSWRIVEGEWQSCSRCDGRCWVSPEAEQAEFIRLQVDLARRDQRDRLIWCSCGQAWQGPVQLSSYPVPLAACRNRRCHGYGPPWPDVQAAVEKLAAAAARAGRLLRSDLPAPGGGLCSAWERWLGADWAAMPHGAEWFERGFVATVRGGLATLRGVLPAVLAHQPTLSVGVLNASPLQGLSGHWFWEQPHPRHDGPQVIPAGLYRVLVRLHGAGHFDSLDKAAKALSDALIAEAGGN